jgi:hypothetical protein
MPGADATGGALRLAGNPRNSDVFNHGFRMRKSILNHRVLSAPRHSLWSAEQNGPATAEASADPARVAGD